MEWNTIFLKNVEKFVVVHGIIKKTQKTPREDIDLSIKRMNDFIKDYKKNEK